jgi:mRNA-degrading endonuclease RelE of RelBE toxin-antitoxin system
MAWTVSVSRSELKTLGKLPIHVQDWAARTIAGLHDGPQAVRASPLKSPGRKYFKVRHGEYRLVFEVLSAESIDVPLIDHRSRIYQRFAALK